MGGSNTACPQAGVDTSLRMSAQAIIIRAAVGFIYPAYSSLKAVMSDEREDALKWLRYWVVLAVFPLLKPLPIHCLTSFLATSLENVFSLSGAWLLLVTVVQTYSLLRYNVYESI